MDSAQRLLFEDLIDKAIPPMPAEEGLEDQTSLRHPRKGHGRRRMPANLEREKVIHNLPEERKGCPCCERLQHIIGKQTHKQFDYVAAKVKVIEHIRLTYGCRHCEASNSPWPRILLGVCQ